MVARKLVGWGAPFIRQRVHCAGISGIEKKSFPQRRRDQPRMATSGNRYRPLMSSSGVVFGQPGSWYL